MSLFEAFPKIPRYSRDIVVTEKLDGTNAQVFIESVPVGEDIFAFEARMGSIPLLYVMPDGGVTNYGIWAGSRSRMLAPTKEGDNFGFARWVMMNAYELVKLGPGRHFGEWYGKGIQCGYGLAENRLALFPSVAVISRTEANDLPKCVEVVTTMYTGPNLQKAVDDALWKLRTEGSQHVPGFMNPEGVIIFHTASRQMFQKTLKGDNEGKRQ